MTLKPRHSSNKNVSLKLFFIPRLVQRFAIDVHLVSTEPHSSRASNLIQHLHRMSAVQTLDFQQAAVQFEKESLMESAGSHRATQPLNYPEAIPLPFGARHCSSIG